MICTWIHKHIKRQNAVRSLIFNHVKVREKKFFFFFLLKRSFQCGLYIKWGPLEIKVCLCVWTCEVNIRKLSINLSVCCFIWYIFQFLFVIPCNVCAFKFPAESDSVSTIPLHSYRWSCEQFILTQHAAAALIRYNIYGSTINCLTKKIKDGDCDFLQSETDYGSQWKCAVFCRKIILFLFVSRTHKL